MILVLIIGGVVLAQFAVTLSRSLRPSSAFDVVAEAGFIFEHHHLHARRSIDGIDLQAAISLNEEQRPVGLKIVIDRPKLPIELTLSAEGVLDAVADLAGRTDFEVGEPRFDTVARVRCGNPAQGIALLSQAARDAIVVALRHRAAFRSGGWVAELPASGVTSVDLIELSEAMVAAQVALEAGLRQEVAEGLAQRLRDDRAPGVRLHALRLLIERGLASPELLTEATGDLDPAVRLAAASALGPAGRPILEQLVRTGSRTWRLEAALTLSEGELEPELQVRVEDTLIAALGDPELAERAAIVLGSVGSPRVAAALRAAARAGPARAAARRALAEIKERVDPAIIGAVSLSLASGGELSEPSTE